MRADFPMFNFQFQYFVFLIYRLWQEMSNEGPLGKVEEGEWGPGKFLVEVSPGTGRAKLYLEAPEAENGDGEGQVIPHLLVQVSKDSP